mgnify:CR=1 FL=1
MADRAVAVAEAPSSIIDTWQNDPEMKFFRETYYGKNINDTQFKMLVLHADHLGLPRSVQQLHQKSRTAYWVV